MTDVLFSLQAEEYTDKQVMTLAKVVFIDYVTLGSVLVLWAVWLCANIFVRYHRSRNTQIVFKSSLTYTISYMRGLIRNWPIEAIVKLSVLPIVMLYLIHRANLEYGVGCFREITKATIVGFVMFTAMLELFRHLTSGVPPGIDYGTTALVFMCCGILNIYHIEGTSQLEIVAGNFLFVCTIVTAVSVLVEMRFRHHIIAALSRPLSLMVTGTWLWQMAFVLYPPRGVEAWDTEGIASIMLTNVSFSWHIVVNIMVTLSISGIVNCVIKNNHKPDKKYYRLEINEKMDEEHELTHLLQYSKILN